MVELQTVSLHGRAASFCNNVQLYVRRGEIIFTCESLEIISVKGACSISYYSPAGARLLCRVVSPSTTPRLCEVIIDTGSSKIGSPNWSAMAVFTRWNTIGELAMSLVEADEILSEDSLSSWRSRRKLAVRIQESLEKRSVVIEPAADHSKRSHGWTRGRGTPFTRGS